MSTEEDDEVGVEVKFSPEMAPHLRIQYYDFLDKIRIDSKDEGGRAKLVPYQSQVMALEGIFDGLENDIHWFSILKARQLGITTFGLALDIFWLNFFPGCQGVIITDTPGNLDKIRTIIRRMLSSLPTEYAIPVTKHNRDGLVLENGSSLDYLVAGVRKTGNLGRSRAYNFAHATECSSWQDAAGLESLKATLSDIAPNRLYIFESTALGYNLWYDMWEDTKKDDLVKKAIFIGWWAKETYRHKRGTKLFERYGAAPRTPEEIALCEIVKTRYGFEVDDEQIAWYRHKKDPESGLDDEDSSVEDEGETIIEQEYPWHEDQAFMLTGQNFFPIDGLNKQVAAAKRKKFYGFRYHLGENFLASSLEQVKTLKTTQLRIFAPPDPEGVYVLGADPAYGSSDEGDRYCIQILRCYADGVEQVAEFVATTIFPYQFCWIMCHLAGIYNGARVILELNGPGEAVYSEFRNLRHIMDNGYLREIAREENYTNVLAGVKSYMYKRMDNIGGGFTAWQWKTTQQNKFRAFTHVRDLIGLQTIIINSVPCLDEMQKIVQDGLEIRGEGAAKDDRAMALALAVICWIELERASLISQDRTRYNEHNRGKMDERDLSAMYLEMIQKDFMSRQADERKKAEREAAFARNRWNQV